MCNNSMVASNSISRAFKMLLINISIVMFGMFNESDFMGIETIIVCLFSRCSENCNKRYEGKYGGCGSKCDDDDPRCAHAQSGELLSLDRKW